MPERIRILVVDDHPAIRKGLAATLEPEPDMEIVGSAATRQQAVEIWRKTRPDITLMDLGLERGSGGVEAIREIRREFPLAKIIVFSALTGDEDVYQALQSGAVTFLTKDTPDEEVVETIRDVHAGGRPIPPEIARKLADERTPEQGNRRSSLHQRRDGTRAHEAHSFQAESQRPDQGGGHRRTARNHSVPLRSAGRLASPRNLVRLLPGTAIPLKTGTRKAIRLGIYALKGPPYSKER